MKNTLRYSVIISNWELIADLIKNPINALTYVGVESSTRSSVDNFIFINIGDSVWCHLRNTFVTATYDFIKSKK